MITSGVFFLFINYSEYETKNKHPVLLLRQNAKYAPSVFRSGGSSHTINSSGTQEFKMAWLSDISDGVDA